MKRAIPLIEKRKALIRLAADVVLPPPRFRAPLPQPRPPHGSAASTTRRQPFCSTATPPPSPQASGVGLRRLQGGEPKGLHAPVRPDAPDRPPRRVCPAAPPRGRLAQLDLVARGKL